PGWRADAGHGSSPGRDSRPYLATAAPFQGGQGVCNLWRRAPVALPAAAAAWPGAMCCSLPPAAANDRNRPGGTRHYTRSAGYRASERHAAAVRSGVWPLLPAGPAGSLCPPRQYPSGIQNIFRTGVATMYDRLVFKVASGPEEFEQIHRLNYRTFVEEIPQHPPNGEKLLVDRFHGENTYFLCLDERQVVGMMALRS